MKFAGSFRIEVSDDVQTIVQDEKVMCDCSRVIMPTGEHVLRSYVYAKVDGDGRIEWGVNGWSKADFNESIMMVFATEYPRHIVRAAQAVLMFTPPETMTVME
jgi:hypothetical protein